MKLTPRSSSWLSSILPISVVFLLTSIMSAAPAAGATSIYACANSSSGTIHIVGPSASCASNEILLVWNISGTNGTNGTSVTFVGYFSGNQNGCPNGGAIYAAGNPPVNAYVCNGTNGTATRADGPCFDYDNRYVDCGNGTVTDTVTGLIWLKHADCNPLANYPDANRWAAGLKDGDCSGNLTDKSSPGDWRLPTKDEWSAMIARAVGLGCTESANPSLTNDAGTACLSVGPSSFVGVASFFYWSSTTSETFPTGAWFADVIRGFVYTSPIKGADTFFAWPVRGGSR